MDVPLAVELAGRCGLPPGGPLVGALALKLCAVRETFEETGLLLLQHRAAYLLLLTGVCLVLVVCFMRGYRVVLASSVDRDSV